MEVILAFATLVALLAVLGIGLRAVDDMEQRNRQIEAELEASRMYEDSLAERARAVRRYRHDAAGLLQAIEFASSRPSDQPDDHGAPESDGISHEEEVFGEEPFAPKTLAQAIVALKQRQCAQEEIRFACDCADDFADAAVDSGIAEGDLCALLQNLLDNAYEASLRIADPRMREMSLSIRDERSDASMRLGELLVEVSNKVDASEELSFTTRKPDSELHGVGLKVIEDVVSRYKGTKSTAFDEASHTFTTSVLLRPER